MDAGAALHAERERMARLLVESRRCGAGDAAVAEPAARLGSGRGALSGAEAAADQRADEPHLRRPLHRAGAGGAGAERQELCGDSGQRRNRISRLHRRDLRAAGGCVDGASGGRFCALAGCRRAADRRQGAVRDHRQDPAHRDPLARQCRPDRSARVHRQRPSGCLFFAADLPPGGRCAGRRNPARRIRDGQGRDGQRHSCLWRRQRRAVRSRPRHRAERRRGHRWRAECTRSATMDADPRRAGWRFAAQHHALRLPDPEPEGDRARPCR